MGLQQDLHCSSSCFQPHQTSFTLKHLGTFRPFFPLSTEALAQSPLASPAGTGGMNECVMEQIGNNSLLLS